MNTVNVMAITVCIGILTIIFILLTILINSLSKYNPQLINHLVFEIPIICFVVFCLGTLAFNFAIIDSYIFLKKIGFALVLTEIILLIPFFLWFKRRLDPIKCITDLHNEAVKEPINSDKLLEIIKMMFPVLKHYFNDKYLYEIIFEKIISFWREIRTKSHNAESIDKEFKSGFEDILHHTMYNSTQFKENNIHVTLEIFRSNASKACNYRSEDKVYVGYILNLLDFMSNEMEKTDLDSYRIDLDKVRQKIIISAK